MAFKEVFKMKWYAQHEILKEIQGLSEDELNKIIKFIRFYKKEILKKEEKKETVQLFWESFGGWKEDKSAEEIIGVIYESRRSSNKIISL